MSRCQVFSDQEIASFRTAGVILRECLEMLRPLAVARVQTSELDQKAESFILDRGGRPAFKGYGGYPFTICTSVNEECVHGLPGKRELKDGDVVSLDCGVIVDGLYTDAAITVIVGKGNTDAHRVVDAANEAMNRILPIVRAGVRVGDISAVIEATAHELGCNPVHGLVGHGLGRTLHNFPDIPNEGKKGAGPFLPAKTVVAIEPIITLGAGDMRQLDDGWTIVTRDKKLCSHTEHTFLITDTGYEILA